MYIHISLIAILCLLFILVHVKFKCKQCNVALVYNANYEGFVLKSIFLYLHKTYAFDLFYDLSIMTIYLGHVSNWDFFYIWMC